MTGWISPDDELTDCVQTVDDITYRLVVQVTAIGQHQRCWRAVGRSWSAEIDAHKEQAERALADRGEAPIYQRIAAEMQSHRVLILDVCKTSVTDLAGSHEGTRTRGRWLTIFGAI